MILTFIVMLLSGMGQPALLYLVPFTVITSAVVAGCRGEMKQFWAGTTYQVRGGEGELYWCFSIIPKNVIPLVAVIFDCQYRFIKEKKSVNSLLFLNPEDGIRSVVTDYVIINNLPY